MIGLTLVMNELECNLCMGVINGVYETIDENKDNIADAINNLCELFDNDSEAYNTCNTFMDTESDKLVDYLLDEFPADVICSLMSMCEVPIPDYSGTCELCSIIY